MRSVDFVTIYYQRISTGILKILKPQIYAKGDDYNPYDPRSLPEAEIVRGYGGRIEIIPSSVRLSSSEAIKKIRSLGIDIQDMDGNLTLE